MERCEAVASAGLVADRRASTLALTQAGASNKELGAVRVGDVWLWDSLGWVTLPGASRVRERRNRLTPWGARAVHSRLEQLGPVGPEHPLLAGSTSTPDSAVVHDDGHPHRNSQARRPRSGSNRPTEVDSRLGRATDLQRDHRRRPNRRRSGLPRLVQPRLHRPGAGPRLVAARGLGSLTAELRVVRPPRLMCWTFSCSPRRRSLVGHSRGRGGPSLPNRSPSQAPRRRVSLTQLTRQQPEWHDRQGGARLQGLLAHPPADLRGALPRIRGTHRRGHRPTRHNYANSRKIHAFDSDEFSEAFEALGASIAHRVGVGQNPHSSLSTPLASSVAAIDGTIVPPLFKGRPDDQPELDKRTGELRTDAATGTRLAITKVAQTTPTPSTTTRGATSGGTSGSSRLYWRQPDQLCWESIPAITPAGSEAQTGVDMFARINSRVPGLHALTYDGAMSGKHADQVYALGVVPCFPGKKKAEGTSDTLWLERCFVRKMDGTTEEIDLYAHQYAPAIRVTVSGTYHYVHLDTGKVSRNPNRVGFRWYQEALIPDDARVPADLVGATLRYRLDKTAEDRVASDRNRTENLRAFAPGTNDYRRVYPCGTSQSPPTHGSPHGCCTAVPAPLDLGPSASR